MQWKTAKLFFFCTKNGVLGLLLNSEGLNNPHRSFGVTVEQFRGLSGIVFNFTLKMVKLLKKMESGALRSVTEIMLQASAASRVAVRSQARKEQKRKCSAYLPRICTSAPLRKDVVVTISDFQQLCFGFMQCVEKSVCVCVCFDFSAVHQRNSEYCKNLSQRKNVETMKKAVEAEEQHFLQWRSFI